MRSQPGPGGSHEAAMDTWRRHSFVPCPEAVALILAEFPDILVAK
jgi:hypothetical protein